MLVPAGLLSALLLTASVASAAGHGPSSAKRASAHKDQAAALRRAGTAAHERSVLDAGLLAAAAPGLAKKRGEKRCKVRNAPASSASPIAPNSSTQPAESMPTSSSAAPAAEPSPSPSSSAEAWEEPAPTPTSVAVALAVKPTTSSKAEWVAPTTTSSKAEWVAPTTSSAVPVASAKPNADGVVSGAVGSLLSITDGRCGWSGATAHSSNEGGPNGAQSWLNCGLGNGGAWTPPFITLDEVVYVDLATNLASGNSPFGACSPYVDQMYAIGAELNIPPILIASIAMQESTCNPSAVGGGGEQGMFQITVDKCGGAPGGNCKDVHFNMRTGMQYLRDTISQNGGDLLKSLGMYNGWQPERMTMESATAARYTSCCRCQNNLDYLHQTLNGWLQGISGYSIGTFWNLKTC